MVKGRNGKRKGASNSQVITFDAGDVETKRKAKKMAREFKPVKISLSSFCQYVLKKHINERGSYDKQREEVKRKKEYDTRAIGYKGGG